MVVKRQSGKVTEHCAKVRKLRNGRIVLSLSGAGLNRRIAGACSDAGKYAAMAVVALAFYAGIASALPQGPTVTAGSSTISQPTASSMQINQSTGKSIINWQGYSIGAGESVRYIQPGASAISLNRVTGADPSYIYGLLSANGQVWVINPNGLLVGPGGKSIRRASSARRWAYPTGTF